MDVLISFWCWEQNLHILHYHSSTFICKNTSFSSTWPRHTLICVKIYAFLRYVTFLFEFLASLQSLNISKYVHTSKLHSRIIFQVVILRESAILGNHGVMILLLHLKSSEWVIWYLHIKLHWLCLENIKKMMVLLCL